MKLFLHLHHFDEGTEEDIVLSLLAADGITERFKLVGRAKEGNSVAVQIGEFGEEHVQPRIIGALSMLSPDTIDRLKTMGIDISLRLHVEGGAACFEPRVLKLAGEKGIQLYVFNPKSG